MVIMNVRIKTPEGHDGLIVSKHLEIEGVERVIRGTIEFDLDCVVVAKLEVAPGQIDIAADATLFTTVEGKRYRLVEEPE